MKAGQRRWTRGELILVMNLYCKLPFGKLHQSNPEVKALAVLLKRTPGAVAFKLVNFASLDPFQKARGVQGAKNASKLDGEIWDEFYNNWESLPFESERLLAHITNKPIEEYANINPNELPLLGEEREQIVKLRVNQAFFRKTVLAAYDYTCCITGLKQEEVLIAGHIRPWSIDEKNRMNPQNGIAINALHDKAFEAGLLTITPEYEVRISSKLLNQKKTKALDEYFTKFHKKPIYKPNRFLPDPEFLRYHNESRFIK